jgi:hypothetical protein
MYKPTLSGEPDAIDGWFTQARLHLFEAWTKTTRHGLTTPTNGWACEIGRGCSACTDHLSIPCSLATEAREIAVLLNKDWVEIEFTVFFRFYLIALSEFVRNLEGVAKLIGLKIPGPPHNVCSWCNNFAKHRLCILIQHHPDLIVADAYGSAWTEFQRTLPTATFIDKCGTHRPIQIIDQKWFNGERSHDLKGANGEPQGRAPAHGLPQQHNDVLSRAGRCVPRTIGTRQAIRVRALRYAMQLNGMSKEPIGKINYVAATKEFFTTDELRAWVQNEQKSWAWIMRMQPRPQGLEGLANHIRQINEQVEQKLGRLQGGDEHVRELMQYMNQQYSKRCPSALQYIRNGLRAASAWRTH